MKRMARMTVLTFVAAGLAALAACADESTSVTCDPACGADQVCSNEGVCVDKGVGVTCEPACGADQVCSSEGACVDKVVGVTCDPACGAGEACAADGTCVELAVTCAPACGAGEVCAADGTCVETAKACEPACGVDQVCSAEGACVDLSATVTCEPDCLAGQACAADGTCVDLLKACDPACGAGQACSSEGACVDLAKTCSPACGPGKVCTSDGACVNALLACDPACGDAEVCINGTCVPKADHATFALLQGPFATGQEVTAACLACHEAQAHDFMQTAHWRWRGPTPGMQGHETGDAVGKINTINNFCIAIRSNEARCTQCHAGYGWADDTFDLDDPESVDCLVCHDTSGQYAKDPKLAGAPAASVDLVMAAASVGPPTRANCGACHFGAGGGDNVKKGDMGSWAIDPTPEADVHMGNGVQCHDCHAAGNHRMAGSGLHNPVEEAPLACTDCHQGPVIHEGNATLDQHTAHVACQTCHIPKFSRQQATKMEWYWETAGDADRVPVQDEYGKPDYDKMKGDFVWAKDVEPELAWYNGTFTRMLVGDAYAAEPVDLGSPLGDIDDPKAKIFPFKVMRGNQPADTLNKVLAIPHLFGTKGGPNPYWAKYDWALAIQEGMAAAGLPYSGTYGFVETFMYMEIHHEVTDQARTCMDCHNGGIDFTALGYSGDPMTVGGEHATE